MKHQLYAVGDFGPRDEWNPAAVIQHADGWPLLEQLSRRIGSAEAMADRCGRPVSQVASALARLAQLGLVHEQAGQWRLGFAWFTPSDLEMIRLAVQPAAAELADRLLARRPAIDASILRLRAAAWSDARDLRFALVGCFGLDWAGLRALKESGHVAHNKLQPGRRRYVLYVEEPGEGHNQKDYNGSHSAWLNERYCWTSFGDHSGDRLGLPDQLIRAGQIDRLEIAAEALEGAAEDRAPSGAGCTILQEIGGLAGNRPAIPVFFGEEDGAAIDAIDRIVQETVLSLVTAQYEALQRSLSGITPLLHQVEFAECFNYIYHDLFGQTNRILAERGYLADPAPTAPGEGRYRWWLTVNSRWSS